MNPESKDQTESEKAIQEFLDNGGVIQQIPPGLRSDVEYKTSFYGARKPKQKEEDSNDGTE